MSRHRKGIEVLFAPAESAALGLRSLRNKFCVVFDVLRATSTMVTALANGATCVIPVAEIGEALALREADSKLLLAGERNGLRIASSLTGSIAFDLGNSPREFTADRVQGRRIAMTTTNGTRALRACTHAQQVLIASFLNLRATAQHLLGESPSQLLLICSGTYEEAAYEDELAAGALCDLVWSDYEAGAVADSASMARRLYRLEFNDLEAGLAGSRNGRRLLGLPELQADVAYCAQTDVLTLVAKMDQDGAIRVLQAG